MNVYLGIGKEEPLGLYKLEQLACSDELNMREFLRKGTRDVHAREICACF
jgi:hypothetical protein